MRPVSPRQRAVLAFVSESITKRGYPPTFREIGARLDIASTNAVDDHLRALARRGLVDRGDRSARGMKITDAGYALLQEPTPEEMRDAVRRAERARGLLIRCWSLLTQVTPAAPILAELRAELSLDEQVHTPETKAAAAVNGVAP